MPQWRAATSRMQARFECNSVSSIVLIRPCHVSATCLTIKQRLCMGGNGLACRQANSCS